MAWRIDNQLVKAELDFRIKGRVSGKLWFIDQYQPVILDLKGNPWRDLAGHFIHITHTSPKPGKLDSFSDLQRGVVGDITASRKVRVPDGSIDDFVSGKNRAWHWGNSLYLEWFSECNGRVVIESTDYNVQIDGQPTWSMTIAEEQAQQLANHEAITGFMDRAVEAFARNEYTIDEDRDRPTSKIEADADAQAARMNKLLDRITARIEREGLNEHDAYERIMEEEREKLRIEMGEPEPVPLTPEEEAERAAWIEEMNAASAEALENMEDVEEDDSRHPLVESCSELGIRLHHNIRDFGWLPETAPQEHPIREIMDGVMIASAKLAGALDGARRRGEWPPDPLFAGDTLVRLKKARNYLRDSLAGLDDADDQRLAESTWRSQTRIEINAVLSRIEELINEVRDSLK